MCLHCHPSGGAASDSSTSLTSLPSHPSAYGVFPSLAQFESRLLNPRTTARSASGPPCKSPRSASHSAWGSSMIFLIEAFRTARRNAQETTASLSPSRTDPAMLSSSQAQWARKSEKPLRLMPACAWSSVSQTEGKSSAFPQLSWMDLTTSWWSSSTWAVADAMLQLLTQLWLMLMQSSMFLTYRMADSSGNNLQSTESQSMHEAHMPTTSTISTGKIISICSVIVYLVPPAARHKDGVPFLLHDTHALCATKVWKRCRIDASVNVPNKISQGITQLVLLLGRVHDPELAPYDICRPAGARWESVRNFCLQVVGISHVCGTVPSCGSMKRDAQNIARDFAGDWMT